MVVLYLNNDEMVVKLYAELKALGYVPVVLKRSSEGLSIDDLKEIVQSSGAVALMNTYSLDNRVDVWVSDVEGHAIRLVETVDSGHGGQTRDSVILKSVELLRARLMKIERMRENGQLGEQTTADDGRASHPPEAPRRISLEIAPMIHYGFSVLPPTFQVFLGAHVVAVGRLGIDLMGFLPTFSMEAKNGYGRARVRNAVIAAGPRVDLTPPDSRWIPWLAACVGAQFIKVRGEGTPPFTDEDDLITPALLFIRLGLDISLVEQRLYLQAAIHTGLSLPTPVVRIGEERVDWGVPLLGGILGVKIDLF